jgi:hypothetical protein
MLMAPEAIAQAAEILSASDFYHSQHQTLFSTILALDATGTEADLVTVGDALREADQLQQCGGVEYLSTLLGAVPTHHNLPKYAKIVKEQARRRELLALAERLSHSAHADDPLPILTQLADAQDAWSRNGACLPASRSMEDWAALPAPDVTWLIEHMVAVGGITLIAGAPETGKSFLAWEMACCAARGATLFDQYPTVASHWLIIDEENPEVVVHQRCRRLQAGPIPIVHMAGLTVNTPEGEAAIRALIEHHDAAAVILDSFSMTFLGNENSKEDIAPYFRALRRIQSRFRPSPAFVVIDHSRKLSPHQMLNRPDQLLPGSHGKKAAADLFFFLRDLPNPPGAFRVTQDKGRLGKHIPDFAFRIEDTDQERVVLQWLGEPATELAEKAKAAEELILLCLKQHNGESDAATIKRELKTEGITERTTQRALAKLLTSESIGKIGGGKNTRYVLLAQVGSLWTEEE